MNYPQVLNSLCIIYSTKLLLELGPCHGAEAQICSSKCLRARPRVLHLPDLRRAHSKKGVHDGVALGCHALEEVPAGLSRSRRPARRVLCAAGSFG